MKSFLFFLFVVLGSGVYAQIKSGTVNYSIVFESGLDNEFAKEIMKDAKMVVAFDKKNSRVNTNMGIYMNTTTIVQNKKKKALTYMDVMGQKLAVNMTTTELEKENKMTVSIIKSEETKDIIGFKCKKANYSTDDGTTGEFWYTTDIKANLNIHQFYSIYKEGFILEHKSNVNGVIMKVSATSIDKTPIEASEFDLKIPEGYSKLTKEEFENLQNGQ